MLMNKLADQAAQTPEPYALPWCDYPTAKDRSHHGLQPLPEQIPLTDLKNAQSYRSRRYQAVTAASLDTAQILQMAQIVSNAFVQREPMLRHVRPPKSEPIGLDHVNHTDPFGTAPFGSWTQANMLYWFVRLFVLTDPTAPLGNISRNEDTLEQSVAIVDENGSVIGGAFNETMPSLAVEPAFRQGDLFLEAALSYLGPALELLGVQDFEAITALNNQYPAFKCAYEAGKVGHHFMVARSERLAKGDTFELVAASVERYQELGYQYMLIEASNQWTGAACELLGGVRVHHAPYRAKKSLLQSNEAVAGTASSLDGYISNKDSGCMFYVIRVA